MSWCNYAFMELSLDGPAAGIQVILHLFAPRVCRVSFYPFELVRFVYSVARVTRSAVESVPGVQSLSRRSGSC